MVIVTVESGRPVFALPGRGEDERVWGRLLPRLRAEHEVVMLRSDTELPRSTGAALMTCANAAASAVLAARAGRTGPLVLLAPSVGEVLPETGLDYGAVMVAKAQEYSWVHEVVAIADADRRRAALADAMVTSLGPELPACDAARLRSMFLDSADLALDRSRTDRPPPCADEIRQVQVPVLVMAAGRDGPASAIARALARRAPKGEFVLIDTALTAYPWLAQPEAAAGAVLDFLARARD